MSYLCYLCLVVLKNVVLLIVPCCDIGYNIRIKIMFCSTLHPVICRRAYVLFMLFVFVCSERCQTRHDYMSNIAGCFIKTEYISTSLGFTPVFCSVCATPLLSFQRCVVFIFIIFSSSCILCAQYCQCLWIVLFNLPTYGFLQRLFKEDRQVCTVGKEVSNRYIEESIRDNLYSGVL